MKNVQIEAVELSTAAWMTTQDPRSSGTSVKSRLLFTDPFKVNRINRGQSFCWDVGIFLGNVGPLRHKRRSWTTMDKRPFKWGNWLSSPDPQMILRDGPNFTLHDSWISANLQNGDLKGLGFGRTEPSAAHLAAVAQVSGEFGIMGESTP